MSSLQCHPEKPGTPRWLLSQLLSALQHHMPYTCKVKKLGVILYWRGREIDALSHALYSASISCKPNTKPNHVQVCNDINKKIHKQVKVNSKQLTTDPETLEVDRLIQSVDPVVWNTMYIFTRSATEIKSKSILHSP